MKLLITILLLSSNLLAGGEWERLIDLRGQWKFTLGDKMTWANPDFNDSDWADIFVPAAWEDEGFPGYNGYAWYRKNFRLKPDQDTGSLYLRLGQIDDVDEVYLNGKLIGFSGMFPPDYITAYNVDRVYRIPPELLREGRENIISVRIYDNELVGGILRNEIGVYRNNNRLDPDLPLDGTWLFMPGDDLDWKDVELDDKDWYPVKVPAQWETQGFRELDGFAWYRKQVYIPKTYREESFILVLGRIDDLDQTYFNGIKIGETGLMHNSEIFNVTGDEWLKWRAYKIPDHLIRYGENNLIAVRIYDGLIQGGIYEGPVGLMTTKRYRTWRPESEKKQKGFFEKLFSE